MKSEDQNKEVKMNRKNILIIVIVSIALISVLLSASASVTWAAGAAGIITDLKGSVTVNGKKAELLQEVQSKAVLTGKAGSKVTVSFPKDGHTESASGEFKVTVGDNALIGSGNGKVVKKNTITKRTGGITPIPITSSMPAAKKLRGMTGVAISPVPFDTVSSVCPSFIFEPNSADHSVVNYVVIKNSKDANDTRAIEITKKDGRVIAVEYPKDMTPLANDATYKWCVSSKDREDSMIGNGTFTFTVLSAEKISALKKQEEIAKKLVEKNPDDLSPYVSLISLYLSNNAYSKAVEYAELIEKRRPNDQNIIGLIDMIYTQVYGSEYNTTIKSQLLQLKKTKQSK